MKEFIDVINSREFRNLLKDNLEGFKRTFQDLSKDRITIFEYYSKLGKDVQSGELPWPVYDEKGNAIKIQANCVGPTGRTRLQTMAAIPVP